MPDPQHLDRQLLREAEGYLDLALAVPHAELPLELCRLLSLRCLAALDRLSAKRANRVHARMMRGQALKLAQRYPEAIAAFEAAAAIDPENIHIHLALAWCHKRNARIDLAIQSLEEALLVDPSEPILYYNLACYWSLARNLKLSVRYLTRALDLDSSLRDLIALESDFDPIRHEPSFQAVTDVIV